MTVAAFVAAGVVLVGAGVLVIARRHTIGPQMALWSPFVRNAVKADETNKRDLRRRGAWFMAVPLGVGLTIFGLACIAAGATRA